MDQKLTYWEIFWCKGLISWNLIQFFIILNIASFGYGVVGSQLITTSRESTTQKMLWNMHVLSLGWDFLCWMEGKVAATSRTAAQLSVLQRYDTVRTSTYLPTTYRWLAHGVTPRSADPNGDNRWIAVRSAEKQLDKLLFIRISCTAKSYVHFQLVQFFYCLLSTFEKLVSGEPRAL
jgi:hypothetical protein